MSMTTGSRQHLSIVTTTTWWGHLLLLCLLLSFASCGEEKQGERIMFYPLANVYFDQDNEKYYAIDPQTRSWQKTKELPAVNTTLGKGVPIPNPSVPVYKDNRQHKLIYGARLYTTKEEIRRKFVEDSLASVPPPPKKEKKKEEKKEEEKKGGFRKWLDKIFG